MKLTSNASTSIFFSLAVAAALGGIAPTALALKETCIEQPGVSMYCLADKGARNSHSAPAAAAPPA